MSQDVLDRHFATAVDDFSMAWPALMPPRRMSVAEGAADALIIAQPGTAEGPWSAEETPYMVEPMNMLASRRHEAVCFVGPARTGKTMGLLDGWMAHTVMNDPGDMLIVQMSQEKAREYSRTRIDRALRAAPKLKAMLGTSAQDDNTHDKQFRHGMWVRIGWPTVSQLSSSDYRYVAETDYDRMEDDIGGEGSAFGLGLKRTTTFLSRGMCLVESSPGRDVEDPHWKPVTTHEAPPVTGVLGIYNRSDRRRWYWKCLDCGEWYEASPGLKLFNLPTDDKLIEIVREADLGSLARKYAQVKAPCCGSIVDFKWRNELNRRGRWLQDGLALTADDEVVGTALTSSIAGYWMGGVAAAYQKWSSLVERYLQGMREYALSGSELTLKNTVNLDHGMPYMSMHLREAARNAQSPADRTEAEMQRYVVPAETRFLAASVDVQGGSTARFVVQVHAVGPNFEQWLVDRYAITDSKRPGMGTEFAPIDPASHGEDWDLLTEKVVQATYKTPIDGKELRVKMVFVDSGGEDGVTERAYAWFRRLRREGLHLRVGLYKGASAKDAPMIRETFVGNSNSKMKGDIPLYLCNPNLISDAVDAGLRRTTPGPGYYHFPTPKHPASNPGGWLSPAFFTELSAEVRGPTGVWAKVKKRNESFDLCRMIYAACLKLGLDKINWAKPKSVPPWARPLAENSELVEVEVRREEKDNEVIEHVQVVPPRALDRPRRARRAVSSPYLR